MRLAHHLLHVLDTALRRWAGLRVERLVVGLRAVYVELEGGWCAAASHGGGEPIEIQAWPPTPRALARLADRGGLAAVVALTGVAAASSAWLYSSPPPGLRVVKPPVEGLASVETVDRELAEALASGSGDCVGVGFDSLREPRGCTLLVGPVVHPMLAGRLGFTGVLGVHARPELCPRLARLVSTGWGLGRAISRIRGLVLVLLNAVRG